jgi:hypothetical protein
VCRLTLAHREPHSMGTGVFLPGKQEAETHSRLVQRLRMSEAMHPYSHISLWRAQGQPYPCIYSSAHSAASAKSPK